MTTSRSARTSLISAISARKNASTRTLASASTLRSGTSSVRIMPTSATLTGPTLTMSRSASIYLIPLCALRNGSILHTARTGQSTADGIPQNAPGTTMETTASRMKSGKRSVRETPTVSAAGGRTFASQSTTSASILMSSFSYAKTSLTCAQPSGGIRCRNAFTSLLMEFV